MKITRKRISISFAFDPKDILLFLQIDFTFVITTVVCAILQRICGFEKNLKKQQHLFLPVFFLYLQKWNKTGSRMGSYNSGNLIARGPVHLDIRTCNLKEPQKIPLWNGQLWVTGEASTCLTVSKT